jgi:SNF2-related domain
VEAVFRETARYAARVTGLGLWQPRVLPWIKLATTSWFGPETDGSAQSEKRRAETDPAGIVIGEQTIPLSDREADELRGQIETAMGQGLRAVTIEIDRQPISVPASYETLAALEKLQAARSSSAESTGGSQEAGKSKKLSEKEVLVIKPNEEQVESEGHFGRREAPSLASPSSLTTPPKQHQLEGLKWLQKAWATGRPGVLLADDMGLGKTLQALAFLVWLREGMSSGIVDRAPIIVVAPTGLLENWRAEHDRHLSRPV